MPLAPTAKHVVVLRQEMLFSAFVAPEVCPAQVVPFVVTIDWELNYHLKRHDFVVYWLEPPLVSQGSDTGVHASSLR